MGITLLTSIAVFAFFYAITPGPSNITIMSSGVNFGFRRSCPQLFGIGVGFPALVLVTGFGLVGVFHQYPLLQNIIRYTGVAYLLYLAWGMAMSHGKLDKEKAIEVEMKEKKARVKDALPATRAAVEECLEHFWPWALCDVKQPPCLNASSTSMSRAQSNYHRNSRLVSDGYFCIHTVYEKPEE